MTNIVYQIILQEAQRMESLRKKDLDLYVKDENGEFVKVAEAYDSRVEELKSMILRKKKTRFYISFTECMDMMDDLQPSAHKMLRFMVQQMNASNIVSNFSYRDITDITKIHLKYVQKGIKTLIEKDIIRYRKQRGGRIYFVNPTYFYKGKLGYVFKTIAEYDKWVNLEPLNIDEIKSELTNTNDEGNVDLFLKKPIKNIFE